MRALLFCFTLTVALTNAFSPLCQRHIVNHNVKWSSRFNQGFTLVKSDRNSKLGAEKSVIDVALETGDNLFFKRIVRIATHAPTLASLFYFGLVSMTSMMGGPGPLMPTLTSVLTKALGSTTNAEFSAFFPTLITPPSYIFLIWPLISIVQLVTVTISSLRPSSTTLLSDTDLAALSCANIAATAWIFVSSKATKAMLPIASLLVLPAVPLLSGFPLRLRSHDAKKPLLRNVAFQLFSSFTTIASFLALTVELQHGGRVPFFKGKAELSAMVFLSLYYILVSLRGQGAVKKTVNAVAITGILVKRLNAGIVLGAIGIRQLLMSASFIGTCVVAFKALKKLFDKSSE